MVGYSEISEHIKSMCPKYFPALSHSSLVVNQADFNEQSTYPIVKLDVVLTENPAQVAASIVVKPHLKLMKLMKA